MELLNLVVTSLSSIWAGRFAPELRHPYQQRPVTAAQSKTRRRTPQGDAELMTEKQVLGLKQAPRLEQVGDEHSERVQDCKHRLG
jgi:hypothetical protein